MLTMITLLQQSMCCTDQLLPQFPSWFWKPIYARWYAGGKEGTSIHVSLLIRILYLPIMALRNFRLELAWEKQVGSTSSTVIMMNQRVDLIMRVRILVWKTSRSINLPKKQAGYQFCNSSFSYRPNVVD